MGQCLSSVSGSNQEMVHLLRVMLRSTYVSDDDLRRLHDVCVRISKTHQATFYETLLFLRVMRHADATRGEDTYDECFNEAFRGPRSERTRLIQEGKVD